MLVAHPDDMHTVNSQPHVVGMHLPASQAEKKGFLTLPCSTFRSPLPVNTADAHATRIWLKLCMQIFLARRSAAARRHLIPLAAACKVPTTSNS